MQIYMQVYIKPNEYTPNFGLDYGLQEKKGYKDRDLRILRSVPPPYVFSFRIGPTPVALHFGFVEETN